MREYLAEMEEGFNSWLRVQKDCQGPAAGTEAEAYIPWVVIRKQRGQANITEAATCKLSSMEILQLGPISERSRGEAPASPDSATSWGAIVQTLSQQGAPANTNSAVWFL